MPSNVVNGFNINGVSIPYNYDALGNKLEKTSIAREYSNIDTYDVDEYVLYNGRMYRCKQKILVGESFNSTKWVECSIGPELNYIKKFIGFTEEAKQALLKYLKNIAYFKDEHASEYYDELEAALFQTAEIVSISAVFNQGSAVIYDTDDLDTLRQYLTVTATYEDLSTREITAYTLSGELSEGTSTITVSYGGKTATFDVTVTHSLVPAGYMAYDYIRYTGENKNNNASVSEQIRTQKFDNLNALVVDFDFIPYQAQTAAAVVIAGQKSGQSGNNYLVAFYSRTDTKRVSCFSHGTALGINDNPNVDVGKIAHINLNPGTASPSVLSVDSLTDTQAWTNTNVINSALAFCGNAYSDNYSTLINFAAIGILRIYDLSENLVGEYIPCIRTNDNVVGVYDTVAEEFHTTPTQAYATSGNENCVWAVGNWEVE